MMHLGRGGLLRSKTGCVTCRIRRVKCDETKPRCARCQKSGFKCDGYNTSYQRSPRGTSPRAPSALPMLPSFDTPRQREFFAFFVSCTAGASNMYFGANFWSRRVLQLSLSEDSIRYALCSLSALQRIYTASPAPSSGYTAIELRNYSLDQYSHAVRCMQELLSKNSKCSEDDLIKGLVACVLFVCYENFTGNYQTAHMHLQNGLQIITKECRNQRRLAIPKDIIQVFKRLDLEAISFGDSSIPHPEYLREDSITFLTSTPPGSPSIEDSFDVALYLCRWIFLRPSCSDPCPIAPDDLKSAFKALEQWNSEIEHFATTPTPKTKDGLRPPTTLLRMYQIIIMIIINTGLEGRETLHDDYVHKYEQVLALGEELLLDPTASSTQFFCFDVGIIFPLFWVATKCRQSRTRRRAVHLLRSMHHQEGNWKSTSAARVAELVIAVEEEGLGPDVSPHEVREEARVHLAHTTVDTERGEIRVSCLLRSDDDGGTWYTRDGRVPYLADFSRA